MKVKVRFREANANDRAFIVSSWVTSYREAYSAGIIQNADWHRIMRDQANRILDRSDVRTIVAYDPSPEARAARADILGYIVGCAEDKYVVFVYVKDDVRRAGVARWLFEQLGIDPAQRFEYACRTAPVKALAAKIPNAVWNPHRIRREATDGKARTPRERDSGRRDRAAAEQRDHAAQGEQLDESAGDGATQRRAAEAL